VTDEFEPDPETVEEALALIAENPDEPYYYQQLGGLYFRRGELKKAWQAYMDALKINPDDPFTCLYFGNLLEGCAAQDHAMDLYRHAAKNAPELPVVHWCMANLYRKLEQFEEADKSYRLAVEVGPTDKQAVEKLQEWEAFLEFRNQQSDPGE